jgi:hypothetical protein
MGPPPLVARAFKEPGGAIHVIILNPTAAVVRGVVLNCSSALPGDTVYTPFQMNASTVLSGDGTAGQLTLFSQPCVTPLLFIQQRRDHQCPCLLFAAPTRSSSSSSSSKVEHVVNQKCAVCAVHCARPPSTALLCKRAMFTHRLRVYKHTQPQVRGPSLSVLLPVGRPSASRWQHRHRLAG